MRGKAPYTFYRSRDGAESASAAGGVKSNGQMSEILFPTSAFRFPSRLTVDIVEVAPLI